MFIYLWFSFIAMLQHSLTVNFSAELNFSVFEPTLWIRILSFLNKWSSEKTLRLK